ncbi:MAG: hypothetical protein AAF939_20775, partial [Planctomycetota bacterium]
PDFTESLNRVASLKEKLGIWFAFFSTAIFGGFLPLAIPRLLGSKLGKNWNPAYLLSNLLFWGIKGMEVDIFYWFQTIVFGNSADFQTVAFKVAFDQFVYVPLFGGLNVILFYIWRDCNYSLSRTNIALGKNWYWRKVLPVLISNWFVWIPSCSLVYLLPLGLQLPIQNLILCFWVLIVAFMTENRSTSTSSQDVG